MTDTPESIKALFGKRVRVKSPVDSSRWDGRVVLPASYEMDEFPEPEVKVCPACHQPESRLGLGFGS